MSGQNCPDCGTPPGGPEGDAASCGCLRRAAEERAEERKEARAAEAAEAGDFTPLRVRPYVSLPEAGPRPGVVAQPLPAESPAAEPVPTPVVTAVAAPRRRRGGAVLAAVGAVAAVGGVALLAQGLFSGGSRDEALPDTPSVTASTPVPPPSPSASEPAPSRSPGRPSAQPRRTARPSAVPAPPRPEPTAGQRHERAKAAPAPALQRGDRGPEVAELQRRLTQALLYGGPVDGVYDAHVENSVRGYQFSRGIKDDPKGVYGAATRRSLEEATRG